MTRQEAEEIVENMKKGLTFSDEDIFTNELWSLSYNKDKNEFSYTTMWMVIGSILSDTKFTEAGLISVLENRFEYSELMTNAYWNENPSASNDPQNNDQRPNGSE